jgi:hypothetical protein
MGSEDAQSLSAKRPILAPRRESSMTLNWTFPVFAGSRFRTNVAKFESNPPHRSNL